MEQYLINHSPLSKSSSSPSEELSLNSILEGRSRKLCARMFYEILVSLQISLVFTHVPLGMWVYIRHVLSKGLLLVQAPFALYKDSCF